MKKLLFMLISVIGIITIGNSQCNQYYIYESFSSTLPTQQGTWINTSVLYGSTAATIRTGTHYLAFNAVNDAMRLPLVANPGVLSFYYRRSSTSTGTPKFVVQTSTNGTTWTDRLTLTTFTTSYVLASINLGALSLTNVHIRIIDLRASGTAERYIEDLLLTATSNNSLLSMDASCSQQLSVGGFFNISDNGGPGSTGGYSNSVNRTLTITPADNTTKVSLQFLQFDLETGYDSLYVYDGPTIASTRILAASGTTIPSAVTASGVNGELTIQWKTDISNVGVWGGFLIEASTITPLPVELTSFTALVLPHYNIVQWSTASEYDSHYFDLQSSHDGENWKTIAMISSAGNSQHEINYSWIDYDQNNLIYYKLIQFDIDGKYKEYGPIYITRNFTSKVLVGYINLMGQEVNPLTTTGLVIEVFDDGSTKKVIR